MYGHVANNNKLTDSPGRKSRVFSCSVPRRYRATRTRGTRTGGKAIFHALCENCKENLAKTRLKTEISRKTRKFLLKNLHAAKICRKFAVSKRKTNKSINQMKHFEENEKVYIGRTRAYFDWDEDDISEPDYWTWSNDKNSEEFAGEVFELTPDGVRHLDWWITCRQMNLWQRKNSWNVNENSREEEFYDLTDLKNEFIII